MKNDMSPFFGCIEATLSLYLIAYRFESTCSSPSKLPLHRSHLRFQSAFRILASNHLTSLFTSCHQTIFADLTDPKELEEVLNSVILNPSYMLSAIVSLTAVIALPRNPNFLNNRYSV